jgi:hypothetical protein
MKNLKTLSLLIALVFVASVGFGQTILTNTTLSSAMTSSSTQTAVVASATGINAPSTSDNTKATYLYVDRELMFVTGVNSTTITVIRGAEGTNAAPHAASAIVFVVPAYLTTSMQYVPQGSCTRSSQIVLPLIQPQQGSISDCLGGVWVTSGAYQETYYPQPNGLRLPDPGATALTSLETAGTAPSAATEQYCTELDIPQSMVITGLAVLNGTTVGTDKHLMILYDSSGKVLANSATAGATTSGASTYQKYNFTAKYFAPGPVRLFGCVQTNGTTDTIRHAITAVNDNILGGAVTGQTFGTVAAVTLPSTFTTAKAPYMLVY